MIIRKFKYTRHDPNKQFAFEEIEVEVELEHNESILNAMQTTRAAVNAVFHVSLAESMPTASSTETESYQHYPIKTRPLDFGGYVVAGEPGFVPTEERENPRSCALAPVDEPLQDDIPF